MHLVSVFTAVAGLIGLVANEFDRALETAAVDDHLSATHRLMQHAGLRGFPCFLLERGVHLVRVEHEPFCGRPADFLNAIKALDPTST